MTTKTSKHTPEEGQIVHVHGGVAQYRSGVFYTGMETPRWTRPIQWDVKWFADDRLISLAWMLPELVEALEAILKLDDGDETFVWKHPEVFKNAHSIIDRYHEQTQTAPVSGHWPETETNTDLISGQEKYAADHASTLIPKQNDEQEESK